MSVDVDGYEWMWVDGWMLVDVGGYRCILVDVSRCGWMSVDVSGCQWM